MALLTGDIATAIYNGFKGKLLTGTLTRNAPSATKDALGDPVSNTPTTYTCEGFVDNYSTHTRAVSGIPATDVKVCIFAKSLSSGTVSPQKSDVVTFRNPKTGATTTWQLRGPVNTDPAGALHECQAYAKEPDA